MRMTNNKVNLCDSCKYIYPDCPVNEDDVLFGDGVGDDNICCCNCYRVKMPDNTVSKGIYDSSILSANMETYVKQLKIAQQKTPALATEEARKALRRTGVMADTSTKRKKRIVSWE